MKEVDCCYNCTSFKQLEFNLMWFCMETGNQVNPNNICEKHNLKRWCANCNNNLGNGACTGNSKNEMVDYTGELKCWEPKEEA